MQYFHNKLEIGRLLNDGHTLEGHIDGLRSDIKPLLTLNLPKNSTEWLTVMSKLLIVQESQTQLNPKHIS